uniref:Reverse transcriptase Ty1/copia-type domain-containing protein n=1 Tax=Cannabis sativa TaxID=3483 RepID=A0A803QE97_CANSA
MAVARFEMDKFNGTNNFNLWRIKMKAFLVHQGIHEALDKEAMKLIEDKKKKLEIELKAYSAIPLVLEMRDVVYKEEEIAMKTKVILEIVQTTLQEGRQIEVDQSHDNSSHLEDTIEDESCQGDLSSYQLARDRERRESRPLNKFGYADFIAHALTVVEEMDSSELTSYQEAINGKDGTTWLQAIDEEKLSLVKNKTWIMVRILEGCKLVGFKWIFKHKKGILGVEPTRFKARLVAKGSTHKECVDFNEIFSPVVKRVSIRVIMAKAAKFSLEVD